MSARLGVAPAPLSWENTVVTVSPSPLPAADLAEAPEHERSATVVEGTSSAIAHETLASDQADSWLDELVQEHAVAHGSEQTSPLTPAAESSSSLSIMPFVALVDPFGGVDDRLETSVVAGDCAELFDAVSGLSPCSTGNPASSRGHEARLLQYAMLQASTDP